MNIRSWYASVGFAAMAIATAVSSQAVAEVSIPFANHGGIRNWEADREQGLWVQDSRGNWYYAKVLGRCTGLNFATRLGFDTRPMGNFDRFTSIIVPREGQCTIESVVPSEGPPTKRKKPAEEAGSAS